RGSSRRARRGGPASGSAPRAAGRRPRGWALRRAPRTRRDPSRAASLMASRAQLAPGGRLMRVSTEAWHVGEAPVGALPRNPGTELMLDWVQAARVNRSAVERRTSTLTTRRSVKKQWQAAWLLKAITLIDLTTLSGDDTPGRVRRLCAKALNPVRRDLLEELGVADLGLTVGAVCVYHEMVPVAVQALRGSGVPVAAVSTGFPAGLSPFPTRVEEIVRSVSAGAAEIDVVISRRLALTHDWQGL